MSRTTFTDRFEKTQKFFDNAYHHHKATYKGLAQFFTNYADVEKNYANALLWQSQSTPSCIPDFAKEQPSIQLAIREICSSLEKASQLHHNLGERLRDIGEYCRQEYGESKKKKQKLMKEKFQKNEEAHDKIKEGRNRDKLNQKEKEICNQLYNELEGYLEDQFGRAQKIKEQILILFSLTKKITEKEVELANGYFLKMAQFEGSLNLEPLEDVEEALVLQYNGYGEDKLERKNRQFTRKMEVNRESLKESMIRRERATKIDETITKMTTIVAKYKSFPEDLNYQLQEEYLVGLFDKRVIPNYRQYCGEFRSQALKEIAYSWFCSFSQDSQKQNNAQSLLKIVMFHLKVRYVRVEKVSGPQKFVQKFMEKCESSQRSTMWFLVQLSQVYEGTLRISQFDRLLRARQDVIAKGLETPIHWKIGLVLVDSLIDSVITIDSDDKLIYDEYMDILKLICEFGRGTFNIPCNIVVSLFLRKVQRAFSVTGSSKTQQLQQICTANLDLKDELSQTEELKLHICHNIIGFLTTSISQFYKSTVPFCNLIKMSRALELVLPKNYFTATDHMHACIRMAGFKFFQETDEDGKILQGLWQGEERLKNITQTLEQLELQKINVMYFEPNALELAKILGVGPEVVLDKLKREFSLPIAEVVQCNIQILNEQGGVDKEGYVLRLGLCLTELDLQQPQPLPCYQLFFKVLSNYLGATEKEYDKLLEHARKTQLWIVEQNCQATQNCIDFCSLLYKPFEFLLTSLKKLEGEGKQTDFTKKYIDFIKLRLNSALKEQIEKYVKFLDDSLNNYTFQEPELLLKYKRLTAPYTVTNEEVAKERYLFKEVTKRYFNLIFLKDQLNDLVCDFIDRDIYEDLNHSIFNLDPLRRAAQKHQSHQAILTNIHSIALLISDHEEKLLTKVASISVYHFMRRVLGNLYYQEEKGFFSSDKDYKLSDYTFVSHKVEVEELFTNVAKNIPKKLTDKFSLQFCKSFCKAYRVELVDTNKFKIPIKADKIGGYLRSDLNFFCNLAKQYLSPQLVREHLEEPCLALVADLEKPTQKLMEEYSEANVKGNTELTKYCLCLLNLRKEDRAEDFVMRYKKFWK